VDAIAQDLAALIDLLGGDHAVAPQSAGAVADAIATVESVGRLMDCARVRVLAPLIDDPLWAERLGHASPSVAVASIAGISERSARARLAIAGATSTDSALTGEVLAASRPVVSAALDAGRLGLDAANLIVTELRSIAGRTPANVLDIAESVMVGLATGVSTTGEHMAATVPAKSVPAKSVSVDFLTGEVRQVTAAADPDGARPREERATRRREFRLGTADEDGLVSASGRLLPEIGSLLAGMLEAYRRSPRFVGAETSLIDSNDLAVGIDPRTPDPRTPGQRRHDALGEIILAAAATEGSPRLDGHAVTVLVTVTAADLADEDGRDSDAIGVMSGSPFPVSRRTIEGFIDAGGYRVATIDDGGRVTAISSPQRCFTPMQRLGMVARDGLGCVTPGCSSPHYTLQAHHVIPDRDGGPTALDNGLLLCYWHHQQVDTGPWQYRMIEGLPYVRGPGVPDWTPARKPVARIA
ncbi:DUF222 domain-containing protein, partial [Salinibacterium sp.]|uniref:HNH endonuclease signature motif containing protein n=2 Tax=Salinibacterium sp. TaxID=1915057 RepID=UPI00286C23D3